MTRPRQLGEVSELVEEILILIPPDEPTVLIRASLVCKAWCCLLSGHSFRSRYRVLHKTPPILGYLQNWASNVERFVPTTSFRPRNPKRWDVFTLDCRHGRVLLGCEDEDGELYMVVWDPVSGSRMELRAPSGTFPFNYSAEVLCAADGCNHTACNLGPFFVAFIGREEDEDDEIEDEEGEDDEIEDEEGEEDEIEDEAGLDDEIEDEEGEDDEIEDEEGEDDEIEDEEGEDDEIEDEEGEDDEIEDEEDEDDEGEDDEIEIINYHQDKSVLRAYVYSSETQEWTSPASIRIGSVEAFGADLAGKPSVLVGQALHFLFTGREHGFGILKYDLAEHSLSTIGLPGLCVYNPLLVLADDGGLSVVHLDKHNLCIMWSMEVSLDGVVSWIQLREMDLNMLLPVGHPLSGHRTDLVGYVEGTEIIIAATDIGAFTIDLKSLRLRELVSKKFGSHGGLCDAMFLYMSFSNPPGVLDDARARASKLPPYRKMPTANFSRARARASKFIFF